MATQSYSLDTVSVTTKSRCFAAAAEMAGKGIATVSIDWVSQGERQLPLVNPAPDCAGDPVKRSHGSTERGCYYSFYADADNPLIPRDNLRQSALDYMVFIKTLLADCGDSGGCSGFKVNADKAGYLGLSVGGLIGQLTVAMSPEIKALALTNTGIGVVELLGNSTRFIGVLWSTSQLASACLRGNLRFRR